MAAALAAAALAAGCSVNPATGEKQLMLISQADEIAMGREADPQIVASMGLYPDEAMQAYVQELGTRLAAASERPDLPWTFRVLDDPLVNAFALPGGYIYVTRGIMSHLNSEAELVAVLGHEIGHVTARHSASRLSKAQLMSVGLGVGMILSPEVAQFGDLLQSGMGLLFLKYSRDDERQADDLGLRYTVDADYDPREMPRVFEVLKRVSRSADEESGGLPSWLSTHPDPDARGERISGQIAALPRSFDGARVARAPYVDRLDGMIFGENPREGFFAAGRFLHPDLEFELTFPPDWTTVNSRQSVDAISPNRDALVRLELAAESDPVTAARKFLGQQGLTAGQLQQGQIGGFQAAGGDFEATTQQGTLRGRVAFVRYRDTTFRLLGYTSQQKWSTYGGAVGRYIESFARLTDRAALDVQPARLETVTLSRPMPLDEFQRRYPSSIDAETLALINHLEPGEALPAQVPVKRVVGGNLPG